MAALPPVLVIGAGVIGLSTAVTFAEAGYPVVVRTAEPPEATTSAVAGALWGPWLVQPRHPVLRWAAHTLTTLRTLAAHPGTGVRLACGIDVSDVPHDPPDWAHLLPDRRPCTPDELPAGYAYGTHCTVPLVDMPTYLTYLNRRLTAAGGAIQIKPVTSLDDVAHSWPLIVNCALLGLRQRDHQSDQHHNIPTPMTSFRRQLLRSGLAAAIAGRAVYRKRIPYRHTFTLARAPQRDPLDVLICR